MRQVDLSNPYIGKEEATAVYNIVKDGWISMGQKVMEFENMFADFVGVKHAIAMNNGTSALHLAVIASGIKEGDEVLVPDITFISTANVVLFERAIPVLVECDPDTYNIDLEDAQKRITDRTKAIIPVDMNGMPVDYDTVAAFAKQNDIQVIADSAESLGAVYKGSKTGGFAPTNIFSFFPNKNLTTGEGGMLTTNDDDLAEYVRQLRNQGQDYRYHHIHLGYNYRMNNIAAVIGIEQLKKIEKIINEKQKIAQRYNDAFQDDDYISAPFVPDYVDQHSWYMYAVSLGEGIDRDGVAAELKNMGVDTRLSFPPIHTQPYYQQLFGYDDVTFPASLKAWQKKIDLPIWCGLTKEDQNYVISCIKKITRKKI
jgi:dTDP-4-amino-4,6-dideoxygalactose transaminase